jgi:hypothetical protein
MTVVVSCSVGGLKYTSTIYNADAARVSRVIVVGQGERGLKLPPAKRVLAAMALREADEDFKCKQVAFRSIELRTKK